MGRLQPEHWQKARIHLRLVERVGSGRATQCFDIFCPFRATSQSLELCRVCPYFDHLQAGSVVCRREPSLGIDETRHLLAERRICTGIDSLTSRVLLGERSAPLTLCVSAEAPAAEARGRVAAMGALGGIVVDHERHPIGFLSRTSLEALPPEGSRRPVGECTMDPFLVLAEDVPLDEGIGRMLQEHQRVIVTTDRAGRATGIVSDIDVLRWIGSIARRMPA